jgi:hypothetical protein
MIRLSRAIVLALGAGTFAIVGGACSGDTGTNGMIPVGTACVPTQELNPTYAGSTTDSVSLETGTKECAPGVCLVAYFRGRVTCPYGQAASTMADPATGMPAVDPSLPADDLCYIPGAPHDAGHRIQVPVAPQLVNRPPDTAVICSCRCAGPNPNATYCACPSGFVCADLIKSGGEPFQGSYCVKPDTAVTDVAALSSGPSCDLSTVQPRPAGCGDKYPDG